MLFLDAESAVNWRMNAETIAAMEMAIAKVMYSCIGGNSGIGNFYGFKLAVLDEPNLLSKFLL